MALAHETICNPITSQFNCFLFQKCYWEWLKIYYSWGKYFLRNNGYLHQILVFISQFLVLLTNCRLPDVLNNKIQTFTDGMKEMELYKKHNYVFNYFSNNVVTNLSTFNITEIFICKQLMYSWCTKICNTAVYQDLFHKLPSRMQRKLMGNFFISLLIVVPFVLLYIKVSIFQSVSTAKIYFNWNSFCSLNEIKRPNLFHFLVHKMRRPLSTSNTNN